MVFATCASVRQDRNTVSITTAVNAQDGLRRYPAVGCRCGVSPIMSTIIQRYRERAEIRRSRRRERGSRSPYPCGFTRNLSLSLSRSAFLFLQDSSWFSSVPGQWQSFAVARPPFCFRIRNRNLHQSRRRWARSSLNWITVAFFNFIAAEAKSF